MGVNEDQQPGLHPGKPHLCILPRQRWGARRTEGTAAMPDSQLPIIMAVAAWAELMVVIWLGSS